MVRLFQRVYQASNSYRDRYGQVRGFLLWFNLHRHLWLRRGTLHRVYVPCLPYPVFLRAQTSDVIVFNQIFIDGELDFDVPYLPASIVDAGANIGLASVYFAHCFPNATIVAIEIDQSNYDLLVKNTEHYQNITCLKNALWSGRNSVTILNPKAESWAFRVGETIGEDTTKVVSLGVLDVMEQFGFQRIDLLKIDIEGGEKEVFQCGADQWISRVGVIAVELHDRIQPGCSEALDKALNGRCHRMDKSGEYTIVRLAGAEQKYV